MLENSKARIVRARMLLGASALISGWLMSAEAVAQSQPPAGAAEADEPADIGEIEDIIVTAQKRREGLQNVPIAITALSGETLQKAGLKSVGDLVQITPSLQFGERFGNIFIALRGIGQAGQDIGSQAGITVSQDGVPFLNHFMMDGTFLDVSRVEVLRGPQGTIEGRNATGGAINVHSNLPTDTPEGEVALTFGNYSRYGIRGFVNSPLGSDRLKGRIAFQADRADGWMKNAFLDTDKNDTNLTQVRASLLGEVTENFSVRTILEYTKNKSDPAFATVLGQARPDKPTIIDVLDLPKNDIENLTVYMNHTDQRDAENLKAIGIARWDISPDVSLTSTTGYIKHDLVLTDTDNDGTSGDFSDFPLVAIHVKQFTQELTLAADLSSRTDIVAGAFYMNGESTQPLILSVPPTLINAFNYDPYEGLDSYAFYGQMRYKLTDRLRITAGGRYTYDDKDFTMAASIIGTPFNNEASGSWGAFTPRFAIDYIPDDRILLYASASRGFKSGGFNTFGDVSQPVNLFDPEFVWNYEAGFKGMFYDRKLRMGVTGFASDYSNLQQTLFRINPQTGVRYPRVENAATATIKGIELELEAIPTAGLRVVFSGTRLFAKFGEFTSIDPIYPELGIKDLTGNRLPQAPNWQFSASGEYTYELSGNLELIARADYKWQDDVYFDLFNNELNTQKSYGLLNASLTLGTTDAKWSLTAYARNAFDKRYVGQSLTAASDTTPSRVGQLGAPRMYGVTLLHRF
ncbi:TonB-dependent receptor [Pseudokordiimonas caeni]|uniref:TonB-dependent receptor n=1 Tax=Pseudokordiimonas caeni TaxID=2997908 RepID=UPI0028110514|nr:TonB-dependent receptor [Pseudokordiimonas caeni]